jgi:Asp-tRNA(Asn)/Glu-tRNA(Gln) amidotransferase A subunit family amidase
MKNEESLVFATIEELAALLAKRRISPVELTELFLRRIEGQNPALNAFLTITAESALAAARRAEKQLLRRRGSRVSEFRSRSRTTFGRAASAPPRDRKS